MVESNVHSSSTPTAERGAADGFRDVEGIEDDEETTPKAVEYKELSRSAEKLERKNHNKWLRLLGRKARQEIVLTSDPVLRSPREDGLRAQIYAGLSALIRNTNNQHGIYRFLSYVINNITIHQLRVCIIVLRSTAFD